MAEDRKVVYITFQTLGCGSIRIARNFATKPYLQTLCQVGEDMMVVDTEGDEIPSENGFYHNLDPETVYTVIEEKNLQEQDLTFDSQEEKMKFVQEKMMENHFRMQKMQAARKQFIKELYHPAHPNLWMLKEDIFAPSYLAAIKSNDAQQLISILKQETPTGIYSFEMFSEKFCREFIEEVENFEQSGLPIMRPNSMNNYGVVLEELGFGPFFDDLLPYVKPISSMLYGDLGKNLDSHHAFIVQYKIGEDVDLDFHYDDSEVTLNVCFGKEFVGGSLYFQGLLEDPSTHGEEFEFNHKRGVAILHIGKHRHGANAIKSGERYNLIVWWRDSKAQRLDRVKARETHSHSHDDHDHHGHSHSHAHKH